MALPELPALTPWARVMLNLQINEKIHGATQVAATENLKQNSPLTEHHVTEMDSSLFVSHNNDFHHPVGYCLDRGATHAFTQHMNS